MTEGSAKGFWMSATLHGSVAAAFFILWPRVKSEVTEQPKIFELVAGEGDNYMAKEAPALGTPGGVKAGYSRKRPSRSPLPNRCRRAYAGSHATRAGTRGKRSPAATERRPSHRMTRFQEEAASARSERRRRPRRSERSRRKRAAEKKRLEEEQKRR